jgi:hypothetical protein
MLTSVLCHRKMFNLVYLYVAVRYISSVVLQPVQDVSLSLLSLSHNLITNILFLHCCKISF